ncbi:MAG: hypothetical protein ACU84Q_04065 [Gammaproteobacteria bacterium]
MTIFIISFGLIFLMMIALGIGLFFGKPGIASTCGSAKTIGERQAKRGRCAACIPAKQRRCTDRC